MAFANAEFNADIYTIYPVAVTVTLSHAYFTHTCMLVSLKCADNVYTLASARAQLSSGTRQNQAFEGNDLLF